jgi:Rps23 Pro-64 3,4-dihydroxylase Tpa1-like proline 4-hydroxylase
MELVDPAHTETAKGEHSSSFTVSDLDDLVDECRENYRTARPWPHLILDGLIDPTLIAAAEAQELERALNLEIHRGNRMVKAESPEVSGNAAKEILDSLLTPQFVSFVEKVTGIPCLIPDPTHAWAGFHVSPPGTSQALHRDFRLHPTNGLFHRVNVLVYLNSDWKEEYGGMLELWSTGKEAFGQQVAPVAGRLVLFETTPYAYHGVPDPVRFPPGRARISLASYYYTDYPAPTDRREYIFYSPKRPQDPWYLNFRPPRDSLFNIWYLVRDCFRRSPSNL